MKNFEHFSVNWVEGMNINASHFIDTENFFLERLAKITSISFNNLYGALPNSLLSPSDIKIQPIGDNARIILKKYYGICPNGFPIFFDESNTAKVSCTTEHISVTPFHNSWYIVLSIAPYQRENFGTPNPNEYPLRFPYTQPPLQLRILNKQDEALHNPFSVIIGALTKEKNQDFSIDSHYIPPALSMDAYISLRAYTQGFLRNLDAITRAAKYIITKITTQPHPNTVAQNIFTLCQELLKYLYTCDFSTSYYSSLLSPLQVYQKIKELAGTLLSSLFCIHNKDKEELFKYFQEWNGYMPFSLEQLLQDFYTQKYEHNHLQNSMEGIHNLLEHLKNLLTTLSQLENIGKHRESIVISEAKY